MRDTSESRLIGVYDREDRFIGIKRRGQGLGFDVVTDGGPYAALKQVPGVVAFFDFAEARAPFASKVGGGYLLRQGPGSRVRKSNGGPLGHSIVLDGVKDYLYIPADECGALNIGANGGEGVYVMAWVKRASSSGAGFVGGIWRENNNNPGRQYGLFLDLPLYGGDNRVCMHISRNGGASPGLPYSRDYSANGGQHPSRDWVCVSGSYDGREIKSWIESRLEPFTGYTEPGAPNGQGLTYDKNPYLYPDGLNNAPADFTVGACELTNGMGNFFGGEIAALLVMDREPSDAWKRRIQQRISGAGWGFKDRLFKWSPGAEGVGGFGPGYNAYRGATAIDDTANAANTSATARAVGGDPANAYLLRQVQATGVGLFTATYAATGITTDNLDRMVIEAAFANTADRVRLCLRVDGVWYASATEYQVAAASPTSSDWTNAEVKELIFDRARAGWRQITLTPGAALSIAGAQPAADLPEGAVVDGWGLWFGATSQGSQRFRNMELFTLSD